MLAGTQLAGLLFFLNPHLPFGPAPVLRAIATYGSLFGAVSLVLILPWTWNRLDRAYRWLPMSLSIVLAGAALSAWIHASYFAFFLPPGINRRLLKAAIWLSLAALVSFYTALIHRVRQRPYGRRSRVLLLLMALVSVYVVVERREAFRPKHRPTPRATTFELDPRPMLCVVGLESATLDAILPLEEQGHLPFFSKMLREGAHARLKSLQPTQRTALWTTLATGKYPYQHGVLGDQLYRADFLPDETFLNLLPLRVGFEHWAAWSPVRSVDSSTLRVRTLWEILSLMGVPTALVGWPLTHPAPEGIQVSLSDRFFQSGGDTDLGYPMELAERARLFRTDAGEIDPTITSRFGARPPLPALEALAVDQWRQDLGLFLLDQDPQVDAFFLVLPGLAKISQHYFGGYSAVQFDGLQDAESEEAAQITRAYYVYLDEMLAQLWELCSEPRLLVVVSVHGVEGYQGWREIRRQLSLQPALEGSIDRGPDGVLMLLGEGIQAEEALRTTDLVDLVPTLLYSLGFPIARDFDGRVITGAFDQAFLARHPLTFMPSYETLTARPRPPS